MERSPDYKLHIGTW